MENRAAGGGGRGGDTQENAEPYIAHNTFEAPTRESVSRGVDLVKSMQVRPALFHHSHSSGKPENRVYVRAM
jgi:hypothetical protein